MANFEFVVDTRPMADQVGTVSAHVEGVAIAVATMQGAVIAAERQSAETICANVNRGFYFLVKSQIGQKAAKLNSEVSSKLMMLGQLAKALESIKRQMQGDYSMIASKYAKVFKELDSELKLRVFALDKDASRLSSLQKAEVMARMRGFGGTLLLHQKESIPSALMALGAKMKRNSLKGINSLAQRMDEDEVLASQLEQASLAERIPGPVSYALPVVVAEVDSLVSGSSRSLAVLPGLPGAFAPLKGAVETAALERAAGFSWEDAPGLDEAVKAEYLKLLEADVPDERLRKEMLRLLDASPWLAPAEARP